MIHCLSVILLLHLPTLKKVLKEPVDKDDEQLLRALVEKSGQVTKSTDGRRKSDFSEGCKSEAKTVSHCYCL